MCGHINSFDTNTKFVILMHPKEFKKVKNNSGFFTHQTLENSELFVGIDFSQNRRINEIIQTHQSYILYPSPHAINLSEENPHAKNPHAKNIAIFLIDSTWVCSKKMFNESNNLKQLKHLSFETDRESEYQIKEQPKSNYLSTIESTHEVLTLLNYWHVENIKEKNLSTFLNPFFKMIEYQKKLIENPLSNAVRFKRR
jgi:DTW domain-containing protein YfiP